MPPQAPGILSALAHHLTALKNDRAKTHLPEYQRGKQATWPSADHEGALRKILRRVCYESIIHVGSRDYEAAALRALPRKAFKHSGFVFHFNVERINQSDRRLSARVMRPAEDRQRHQLVGRDP